jgi:hypothetical protein
MEEQNEEVRYERERSRSRDRGDDDNFGREDPQSPAAAADANGESGNHRDRTEDGAQKPNDNDENVNNLYITNLSFQVNYFSAATIL